MRERQAPARQDYLGLAAEAASISQSLPLPLAGAGKRFLSGGGQLATDNGRSTVINDRFSVVHERFPEDGDQK